MMCNKMAPNMGEWSSSEGVGFCNLISLIPLLSKTNITASFENYELLTGFRCSSHEAVAADLYRVQRLKCHFRCLSLALTHTHTHTPQEHYNFQPFFHAQQTISHQQPRYATLHGSSSAHLRSIIVPKICQSAVQIAPVSTIGSLCSVSQCLLSHSAFLSWAVCVLVTRWQESHRLRCYTVLKASRAKISQPFGCVLFEKPSSGKPPGHLLYLIT